MSYFDKTSEGQIQITEEGQAVLEYLGLTPESLRRMTAGELITRVKRMGDALNDGVERHPAGNIQESNIGHYEASSYEMGVGLRNPNYYGDSGSFSRYFSLDAWWSDKIKELPESVRKTFPFLIEPKAGKEERNEGLDDFDEKTTMEYRSIRSNTDGTNARAANYPEASKARNHHPTVKPLALMSYLITLGSRRGDLVLDPFVGSGTTCMAAKMLGRKAIGIEIDVEYAKIAKARLGSVSSLEAFLG